MKKIRNFLSLVLAALLAFAPAAFSAFDPINDDTDIFLANPNITAERPNVLILLDNTANWNIPFTNEKSALVQVVNNLTDQFNVGLLMMPETGSPNDNIDGGYVRYHVRQMTDGTNGTPNNKGVLSSMVNGLIQSGPGSDVGNNYTAGFALYEAYLYYAGKASRASFGKIKTDFAGNTTSNPAASLPGLHALNASPNASSLYNSPIVDGCQKNFIILISNGQQDANENSGGVLEGNVAALTGKTPPDVIPLKAPSGFQKFWSDELTKFMANADVNTNVAGVQNVFTYVVEVNPLLTGNGPDMTQLMKSAASNGKGKYFGVTDQASGTAIVDALNAIFTEIQAVNSVFASTTLPVSVNVRGTNLNQVYIGVFRPDPVKSPRWLGNLKMYNLALNSATGQVFLADAANGAPPAVGNPAENASTGFVTGSASSFWTADSSFWGFRDASQNGVGGASDKADGDLVEKGGAAQQIRLAYPNAQNPQGVETLRRLYTCTSGGLFTSQCTSGNPGSSLSATPFNTANTDITADSFGLDTRFVSPLTAFVTKAVTALTDRKAATLTNAALPIAVTSLDNGATTRTITNLTTAVTRNVTSLSALIPGPQTIDLSTVTKSGNTCTATATAALPTIVTVNASAAFSGVTGASNLNGTTRTITTVTQASKSFTFACSGSNLAGSGGTATITNGQSTTATATASNHGFTSAQSVTIAGASPSQFNGTFSITVPDVSPGVPDPNKFTYIISPAAGAATVASGFTGITASGNTTTATATYTGPTLVGATSASITGANPTGYNLNNVSISNVTASTFTYTVGSALSPNTASPVYAFTNASTTVVATTAVAHGLNSSPPQATISNSDIAGYNGSFDITVTGLTTFTYTTASLLPSNNSTTVTVSVGTQGTVTATVTNHGFVANEAIVIDSSLGGGDLHQGNFTVSLVLNANSFTYSNAAAAGVAPSGSYTVRPSSSRAIATVPAHGYTNIPPTQVTIAGASSSIYNVTDQSITVVDADTFTYPLTSAPGPNTSTSVTSSVKTTTAKATSVKHGFLNGSQVEISGATPGDFNGTFTITNVPDINSFTYTLGSPQGDATGAIIALQTGTGGSARDSVINWVRGEDNFQDENLNGSTTDIRASVHGDVLHSRPAVINYNRFLKADGTRSDDDVFVFYGANDGIFHAIKGGYGVPSNDTSGLSPGQEAWGFIPQEFFGNFNRVRNNSPTISSSFKKPYFMDGPIGILTKDAPVLPGFPDGNGQLGDTGDIANLYIAMRRGGRLIYALDVNDPLDPKFLWKIDNSTSGLSELGQTWSQPTVIAEGFSGYLKPVLIFGGGYDPAVEDIDPNLITSETTASVTTAAGTVNRTMGRGIYVVDAITGALVWSAGKFGGATTSVSDMHFAIPSDVSVIKNASGLATNRAYVGDTGGNLWRIDFKSDDPSDASKVNLNGTTVTKIAAVGDHIGDQTKLPGRRKFQHAPDVVAETGFDAVLIGSGDREHPFDTGVVNRMYMFKDKGTDLGPVTGATTCDPTITQDPIANASCTPDPIAGLSDVTTNCIQDVSGCPAGVTQSDATAKLGSDRGWFIKLDTGEKVVGTAVAIAGTTFFNTNQPDAAAGGGTCGSNLGIARQYQVSTVDATAVSDLNATGGLTGADRSLIHAGGGYLPSPVHVVVELGGKPVEAVISGIQVTTPASATLQARLRKYWYKVIDQ